MPNARGDADCVLMNTDGTSNVVPIKLHADSERIRGGYRSLLRPFVPAPQPQGESSYAQVDPRVGLARPQTSWHNGFGQALDTSLGRDARYGYTNGVLAKNEGELVLGYKEDEVDIILRNGRFETGDTTGWGATNTMMVSSTGAAQTGTYGLQITADANNGTVLQSYAGTVSVFQSQDLTFVFHARRTSGTGTILARITDDAGSTDSSTVNSESFTIVEVTRTIDAATTALSFTILCDTSGDVWEIDNAFVIPEGGVSFTSNPRDFINEFYVACGRTICKWDEDDLAFYPVYVDTTNAITDLEVFATDGTPRIYAGRGTADNYLVSTDGTTWNDPATNTGNSRLAEFFTVARNAIGNYAMLKNRGNKIALAEDPSDTANWGAEIQVGQDDHATTSLFASDDTALVGKEDGLYPYDRAFNQFVDIEPEAGLFSDADNFSAVLSRGKEVFASGTRRIFWRIPFRTGERWRDISNLISSSTYLGFGGRVTALAQDSGNIWIASPDDLGTVSGGFPYTFPFTFDPSGKAINVRVMTLRARANNEAGDLIPDTVTSLHATEITRLGVFQDATNTRSSLFAFGTTEDSSLTVSPEREPRVVRINLPLDNDNPALVQTRRIRGKGIYYDPWWDGGFPDAQKAMVKLTLTSRNLSSTKKITVYYKTDDATDNDSQGWTLFGTTGVVNTSPIQTITPSLTTPITFRRIRFRYDFETDSESAAPPRVESIVPHAVLTGALDYLEWQIDTELVDQRSGPQGTRSRASSEVLKTTLSNIDTLRQEPFALFEDVDGTQYRVNIRDRTLVPRTTKQQRGGDPARSWTLALELTEVKTS